MCGIAGVLFADSDCVASPSVLERMGASIAHRGPDAAGFLNEPGVALVHRRLSIIDLDGGDQPIGNEDGSVQVVFNGEIYNYHELRAELVQRGHHLRTQTDTEVLVHLYEEMGEALVERLRGMFAFALWDRRRRRLLLARDRVGIKPLFLYRDGRRLLFGSELKSILAFPDVSREIDPAGLDDYLNYGMIPQNRSIFRNIEKLQPGHILSVDASHLNRSPRRYWQLKFQTDESLTLADWGEAVRAKLDETVDVHMVADVPVGAFLSGGLDSSIIVAHAVRKTPSPLRTFSMGFQEDAFNELPFAREIAEQYGTEHYEEVVSADATRLLPELTEFYDEPFADSSAIPTYLVSRLASRHVKVVLSGDGGDEAFGGYSRYGHDLKEHAIRRWLPGWLRRSVLSAFAQLWPKADWLPRPLRAKTLLTNLSLDPDAAYANTLSLCRQPLRRRLLAPELRDLLGHHDPGLAAREAYRQADPRDPLAGMIAADFATLLPDDYLVKVDRASMAHGLEVRPPLLDHEFLELCVRIPSRWKVRQGETKWALKHFYASQLPASVVWRRKQGFEIPVDDWFRGPLGDMFQSAVLGTSSPLRNLIDQKTARTLLHRHQRGTGRFGAVLWELMMLANWSERYLVSDSLAPNSVSSAEQHGETFNSAFSQDSETDHAQVAGDENRDRECLVQSAGVTHS